MKMASRRFLVCAMAVAVACVIGLAVEAGRAEPTPGLTGRYFHLSPPLTSLDQVNFSATADDVVTDAQVFFPGTAGEFRPGLTGYLDNFVVEWTGLIRIDQPGDITFTTRGDDASRLYIDGVLVAETDFVYTYVFEGVGTINLSAGDHDLRMTYLEVEGFSNCLMEWDIGAGRTPVPADVLFTPEPASLSLLALGGLALLRRRRRV